MMMGYYDNIRYNNMYAGPANGGVCPMENDSFWGHGESPLSATHIGKDGRTARGHVEDYWIATNDTGDDPYINNGWSEHAHADCTADFMGTSQSKFNQADGSTRFIYYSDGSPTEDFTLLEPSVRDGCHGMKLFVNSRGYGVISNYSQFIYGYDGNTLGFTYDEFKAEIDANRPVFIHLTGHSMLGYGYNDSGSLIYIHDTWDNADHSMTWGGTYAGMQHEAVTVLQLVASSEPLPAKISVQPQDRISHPGSSASFSVMATGDTPRYYQWQKNSVDIPSATSASYSIASVSAGDAGSYRCRVSNAVNAVMSDAATLTVLPAAPSAIWASATNVSSFTAAWNSVSDATSYRLDVATGMGFGDFLNEDFSGFTAANGSTDLSGSLDSYMSVPGWTGARIYSWDGEIKVGSSGAQGWIVTPPMDLFGPVTVSFRARWWSAADATILYVGHSTDGGASYSEQTIPLTADMTDYEVYFTGGSSGSKIRLQGTSNNKRFFLDDFAATSENPIYVAGYYNRYVSGTSQNVTGLAGDTVYYFRARAVNGSGTGRNSPVGSVRTWRVPTFSGNPGPVATTASVPVAFTVGATGNPGPALALRSTTASGGYEFSPGTGRLDYVPPQADAGTRTFTFTASNRAGVATQMVSVGVTAGIAPAFTSGAGPYSTTVDVAVAFSVGASGRPAPTLALQSTTATGSYSFAAGTGQMNFTPSSNDVGTRTFTFTASNFLGVATQTVSVSTMGLVPAFAPNPGPLSATTSVATAFSVSASGVPPPVLAVAGTTASGGYGFTPETGELAYIPPEVDAGLRTFTFTASNSAGVATQAVDISVAPGIPSAPVSLWAAETNIVDFRAEWSSVPIATSYQLDVATNEAFMAGGGEGGQFLLASNAATSTNLFTNEWTASDIASTTYIQMLKPTSAITSPAFSSAGFTNLTVDFRARTYNGTASGTTNVTVSISTNNGIDWSVIGVVAPALNTMATMPTLAHAANLGGNQTRIRWQTLGASGSIGVGVSNLVVQGWSPGSSPSFVAGYSNRPVGGTSVSVTGLVAETPYYFRVRAISTGGTGTYSAVAGVTTDVKSAAAVFLRDLDQTYDETARAVTATTMPAGLTVEFTYDGHPMAPTNAGSYAVVGTIHDPIHSGSAVDTLVVRKATAAVTLENLVQAYDGTPRHAMAATDPSGLAMDVTYDGSPIVPVTVGTYAVTATVNDVNYEGTTSGTLTIDKGTAMVFLQDLAQIYSGLARTVAATTVPAGLTVEITYDGQAWAPTNAGSYAVTGTVMDANWEGLADGMLVVAKASQSITAFMPTNGSSFWVTNGVGLSATADSGLAVVFRVAAGPGEIDLTGTNLSFAGAGLVAVEASQGGDANWEQAIPETNIFLVTLPLPAAIWASETNLFDFTAEWSPVPFAEEYRLDVGLNPAFEVAGRPGGQFLLASNAATSTNLFTNEWTASDIASTTYIQMLKPTAAITSPAFSTVGFTNLTVDFRARTYGGVNAAYNAIAVSISEDDGATWTPLGTVLPASATMSAMPTLTNEANLGGDQTRIRWQTPGASGSIGAGVMNLTVQGWNEGAMTPACVAGYSNRPVLGTSATVTGLAANTPYYFRACAVSGGEPGLYSAVASVVTKSEATVFLQNLHQTYDGTARTISATTMPVGLEVEITYDGNEWVPTNAGTYAVTGTVVDAIYQGWATGTLAIAQAAAVVELSGLEQTYDGTARAVLAMTFPPGLAVQISYDGNAFAPTNAGEYAVTGRVDNANYTGETNGVLVVSKENQTIDFPEIGGQIATGTVELAATASSGLPVSYSVAQGPGVLAGTELAFSGAGEVSIEARQDGDDNWNPAPAVTNVFAVDKAIAEVTLNDLAQTFDGTAKEATATTVPEGLAVEITYDGNAWAPTNAGTYAATGTVADAIYQGSAAGTLAIAKGAAIMELAGLAQTYDGTVRQVTASTEPPGLAVEITYDGGADAPTNAGEYAVTGRVDDVNYAGETNGLLVVSKADQTIDFPLLNDLCVTDKVVLVAVASSGLDVSFSVTNGPAVIAAETNLHFMGTGDVSVVACQIGNGNWNAAPDVCRTLKVFSNLAHVDIATWLRAEIFAGAFNATVTTDPEDAEVDIEVEEASAFDPLSRSFVFQPLDETEYEVDGKDVTVPSAGTNSWRLFRIRAAPR